MTIIDDVDSTGVHPVLWVFLGVISQRHRVATGNTLIVTSLRRPPGPRPSRHSPPEGELCQAADLRRWALDAAHESVTFARALQRDYGAVLGVVLEPEWLTPDQIAERGGLDKIGPHLHVELKDTAWPVLV